MAYLHRDQLGSLRAVSQASGVEKGRRAYAPFGEIVWESSSLTDEDHGFIGERHDRDAGLIYLNARYYDPELGLFLQPDWFEVTEAGVGTNRYAYAMNDPVNLRDPGGNCVWDICLGEAIVYIGSAIVVTLLADHGIDASDGIIDGSSPLGNPVGRPVASGVEAVGNILTSEIDLVQAGSGSASLQDDGSYITPGGREIRDHGAGGNGIEYPTGKGHTPEGIDGILDNPTPGIGGKTLAGASHTGKGATIVFGPGGDWVIINEDGEIIQVNDRHNPKQEPPDYEVEDEE